ncbi:MAG: hypothetical protein PVJ40_00030 [Gammaproteobacteria bacterium]|jgi:photosystem II stability/assembly factor-like uncharacterized protein
MLFMRFCIVVVTLALFSAPALSAPAGTGQLSWRFVGPYRGGRVLAVSGVPSRPNVYYFGSVGGGVFKSTDGGLTWDASFQHKPVASIGALAVAPSAPDIVYAGTGESAIRSDMSYGDGIWRSDDAGQTWHHIGLDDTRHISRILIDPDDPDTVIVAALGHGYGDNAERGIYRTRDGGRHWARTLFVDDHTGAIDLVRDPDHPARLYATTWAAHRPAWTQYAPIEEQGTALYRSDDDGHSWQRVRTQGLPLKAADRVGVAVAAHTDGTRLYAIVSAAEDLGGLYRSDDAGRHWQRLAHEDRLWHRGWYFGHVYVSPDDPDTVYLPNTALYRSTDGGKSFEAIKGSPDGDDYHVLWFDPANPDRIMLGADQGVGVSVDRGAHWTTWYNQPTAQIYRMATDNAFPYNLYGTQQDSGSLQIPIRSHEGLITNRSWETSGGGESGYVIPDPDNPDIIYGSGYGGSVSRLDKRSHQVTNISPWPVQSFGQEPDEEGHYFPWTTALAVSPFSGSTLYTGGRVMFRSSDRGDHWQRISPDLTGYDPTAGCQGDPNADNAAACGYAVVYSIAPSPLARGMLWAGTTDGRVWRTTDEGAHWHEVTPDALKTWSRIARIEPSPFDADTAYMAVDRHRVDDLSPCIFVTHDGGAHWSEIDRGIAAGAYVHVVRADPVKKGLLFAGTETGVYLSRDDGRHWQSLQLNLPTTSVRDMQVHGRDLVVATHGRGFWALDDITALRDWTDGVAAQPAHLFQPAPAYRLRINYYHGEKMPPEIPHAFNPPTGAIIDYHLGSEVRGPVTLTIHDSAGHVVRRFSSNDVPPGRPVANFRDIWQAPRMPLAATPGMHRFIWDLRWTAPATLEPAYGQSLLKGTRLGPFGPFVMPGTYRVTLGVNGKDYAQPLVVKMDPRVKTGRKELKAQFTLARSLGRAVTRATHLLQRPDHAHSHADAARAILDKYQVKDAYDQLRHLLDTVEAADEAPTGSVEDTAARYLTRLDAAEQAMGAID